MFLIFWNSVNHVYHAHSTYKRACDIELCTEIIYIVLYVIIYFIHILYIYNINNIILYNTYYIYIYTNKLQWFAGQTRLIRTTDRSYPWAGRYAYIKLYIYLYIYKYIFILYIQVILHIYKCSHCRFPLLPVVTIYIYCCKYITQE